MRFLFAVLFVGCIEYAPRAAVCAPDWSASVDELGLRTSGLEHEFLLTRVPVFDPWILQVRVGLPTSAGDVHLSVDACHVGQELIDRSCEVVYDPSRNTIRFLDFRLPPRSEVSVTYRASNGFSAVN